VVRPPSPDRSLRPNQLFAVALPFPLLDREAARLVVDLVARELLTPFGLRTLEPGDPSYRPSFEGSMEQRDRSYHQGTVWPWLIGPFVDAYLYAHGESQETLAFCRELIRPLEGELSARCLGSVSEVYDAEVPEHPGGCPAQLWSITQLILASHRVGRA
jgi:glycogen debranching enzyme